MNGDDEFSVAVVSPSSLSTREVTELYASVGWANYTKDPRRLMRGISGSSIVIAARHHGELIGLCRALTDGATDMVLQDLVVRADYQRRGIGRQLIAAVCEACPDVTRTFLLTDDDGLAPVFYAALGFTEASTHKPPVLAMLRYSSQHSIATGRPKEKNNDR